MPWYCLVKSALACSNSNFSIRYLLILYTSLGFPPTNPKVGEIQLVLLFRNLVHIIQQRQFKASRKAFHNQTFPAELAEVLTFAVPITELLIAGLLLFSLTRWWGYLASILLLTIFITYVGLIWVGAFPRVPCNCAGIIDKMGWGAHFWMNLLLIGLAVFGLQQEQRKKPKADASGF